MAELPEQIYADIERLSADGTELLGQRRFKQAIACFEEALSLLPGNAAEWSAGMWLLGSIGDAQVQMGLFQEARLTLMEVMKHFDEARERGRWASMTYSHV